jgi:hypothetical protein
MTPETAAKRMKEYLKLGREAVTRGIDEEE